LDLDQEGSERKGGDFLFFLRILFLLFLSPLLLPPIETILAVGKDELVHGRE
jgi:hypothetical protein